MNCPDNYDKWEQHEAQQERQLLDRPRCAECDNHIQDEFCYEINGEYICEQCLENHHRKYVDDL